MPLSGVFFFKQTSAYEIVTGYWSSAVCPSVFYSFLVKRQDARFRVLQTDFIIQPVRQLMVSSDIKYKPIL